MGEIVVRAARPDDAADLAAAAAQPQVVWGTLQLPAQTPDQWRQRLMSNSPATSYLLVVEVDGRAVGIARLRWSDHPRTRHVARVVMFVHDAYQGQGLGQRLLTALIAAADRWLNLVRLELEVYPDNHRAVRLYEKHGFQVEGTLRMNVWRDGRYVDSALMARIRPDPPSDPPSNPPPDPQP